MSEERSFHRAPVSVALTRGGPLSGRVRVPGSKSQTARAFVLAALGAGESRITGGLAADDAHHMVHGLRALGISVEGLDDDGEEWRLIGCGGSLPDVGPVIVDSGFAGTVMRFLTAASTLAPHTTTLTGRPATSRDRRPDARRRTGSPRRRQPLRRPGLLPRHLSRTRPHYRGDRRSLRQPSSLEPEGPASSKVRGMSRTRLYRNGVLEAERFPSAQISDHRAYPDSVVWSDVCEPTAPDLAAVTEEPDL